MRKAVLGLALLCGAVSPSLAQTPAQPPDLQLHNKCLYPVVALAPEGKTSYGSGVIVRSDKINNQYRNVVLSCAHVADVDGLYTVKVYQYHNWSEVCGSTSYSLTFYIKDEDRDLAVGVFVSDKEMPVADLEFAPKLFTGSSILGIGCGLGEEPRLDQGTVSAIKPDPKGVKSYLRSNVPTVPGDSGSPLFYNYKVVGIRRAIRSLNGTGVYHISFAIPLSSLKSWNAAAHGALDFACTGGPQPELPYWRIKFLDSFNIARE